MDNLTFERAKNLSIDVLSDSRIAIVLHRENEIDVAFLASPEQITKIIGTLQDVLTEVKGKTA